MEKKFQRGQRYVNCYCEKNAKVSVGMKFVGYMNVVLGIPIVIFLFLFFLSSNTTLWFKMVFIIPLLLASILLPRSYYKSAKSIMMNAGHSERCSRRVGYLAAIHGGGYGDVVILEEGHSSEKDRNV